MNHAALWAVVGLGTILLALGGCSNESGPPPEPVDTTPPAAIADLAALDPTCRTISISWTAPAEDDTSGGAVSSYEIRYGNGTFESIPWDSLTQVNDPPPPAAPGIRQSYVVQDLQEGTLYSFVVRSVDDVGLESPMSNVATERTATGDCIPPGPVSDLAVVDTTTTTAALTWTAPAEDGFFGGRVSHYDLRYTTGTLDSGSWDLADTVSGEPIPGEPGTEERFTVVELSPSTRYEFGVRAFDDSGNESAISNILTVRTPAERDTIPPDPVEDLTVTDIDPYHLRLAWTASGDDGRTGRASAYDLRMLIADHFYESDWDSAEPIAGEPPPGDPGSYQSFEVGGLAPGVTFALALRVIDSTGNISAMSNAAVATAPPPSLPLFMDPRGVCVDPVIGDVMVAEHVENQGTLCRFSSLGERGTIAFLPGVTGVRVASRATWYAIGGEEWSDDGTIWRYDGSQSRPTEFHTGLRYPVALAVRAESAQVIVIEQGISSVVLYGPSSRRSLVTVTDGDPAGVAVDDRGFVYFGVNRGAGTSLIRRCTTQSGPAIDLYDIGPGGKIGDLILDETGGNLWYLDTVRSAIIALTVDGDPADTIATGLIHPVAITSLLDPRFVAYSSSDGYVLRALRR